MTSNRQHYSPVFANKPWCENETGNCYVVYRKDNDSGEILRDERFGQRKAWGWLRKLWSKNTEDRLSKELENIVAPLYKRISSGDVNLSESEKLSWSQFLLSQLVRAKSFMHYEKFICEKQNIVEIPKNNRIGCRECHDIKFITKRDWLWLIAGDDDFFIRSDNPILQTGFIENPNSALYYPVTPKLCFVACSMSEQWKPEGDGILIQDKFIVLPKNHMAMINFYFVSSSKDTFLSHKSKQDIILDGMRSVIGEYPQPPFPLHVYLEGEDSDYYASIRSIMNSADNVEYPVWDISDLQPFYCNR